MKAQFHLAPHPASAGVARERVRETLAPHTDAPTLKAIELVVTELVTNAVRHGPGEPVILRLTAGDGVIAGEVEDQGDGTIAIRDHVAGVTVGGLGLPLVDMLTSEWGVYPGSTHVWFRFEQ